MKLNTLELKNFRNHKNLKVEFGGKSSLIVGENGSGKTNILEAIHLLSTTKSLRATMDIEMISHDQKFARVWAVIEPNGNKTEVEMIIQRSEKQKNRTSKKVKIDKVSKALYKFGGTMNTVLFTPHDVEIFTNSPSIRRKHIDLLFFQIDSSYKKAHSAYTKAVRQRNKLLEKIREGEANKNQLEFWTRKIIETGQKIQNSRKHFFDFCQDTIQKHGEFLNDNGVMYKIDYDMSEISWGRLEKYEDAEIASTRTLIGPHRDDFSIKFNDHDIAKYGSRGQKRSTILALKLCEIDFIDKLLNRRPILLLDDIFSELDDEHKDAILNIVDLQQTIITTADEDDTKNGLKIIRL